MCFEGTKSFAGQLRTVEVVVMDGQRNIIHQGAPFKDVEKLLEILVKWYTNHRNKYPPLLLAALIHNEFETIHPFQDGNGRVGRLLLNYVLLKNDYPPINIKLKDRQRYYKVLQAYQKSGEIAPTLRFLISQVTTKRKV
jgi:Fic family protein